MSLLMVVRAETGQLSRVGRAPLSSSGLPSESSTLMRSAVADESSVSFQLIILEIAVINVQTITTTG